MSPYFWPTLLGVTAVYLGVNVWLVLHFWRKFRSTPGAAFHYHITDIAAFLFGIGPSFFLTLFYVSMMLKNVDEATRANADVRAVMTCTALLFMLPPLLMMMVGKLRVELASKPDGDPAWLSGRNILLGGFQGVMIGMMGCLTLKTLLNQVGWRL